MAQKAESANYTLKSFQASLEINGGELTRNAFLEAGKDEEGNLKVVTTDRQAYFSLYRPINREFLVYALFTQEQRKKVFGENSASTQTR
jgi:hypothetical protein